MALPVDPTPLKSEPGVAIEVKNHDAELALFNFIYPDSTEDRDPNTIPSLKTGIVLTLYVDTMWASELKRHSITGYIIYISSTPIAWYSGKQSQVEGSMYASEFALHGKLSKLCVAHDTLYVRLASKSTHLMWYCDNRSLCSNAEIANSFIKKHHVGIAYHLCREAVTAGVARIHHIKTTHNRSDILTKTLGPSSHHAHCDRIFPKSIDKYKPM